MVDDGINEGLGVVDNPSFTRYAKKEDFDAFSKTMNIAMWGADGRDGLVADVNTINVWLKVLTFIATVISPVLTALLLKFVIGG